MQTHPAFICKLGNISYFETQINVPSPHPSLGSTQSVKEDNKGVCPKGGQGVELWEARTKLFSLQTPWCPAHWLAPIPPWCTWLSFSFISYFCDAKHPWPLSYRVWARGSKCVSRMVPFLMNRQRPLVPPLGCWHTCSHLRWAPIIAYSVLSPLTRPGTLVASTKSGCYWTNSKPSTQ